MVKQIGVFLGLGGVFILQQLFLWRRWGDSGVSWKELCQFISLLLAAAREQFYCLTHQCGHSVLWDVRSNGIENKAKQ